MIQGNCTRPSSVAKSHAGLLQSFPWVLCRPWILKPKGASSKGSIERYGTITFGTPLTSRIEVIRIGEVRDRASRPFESRCTGGNKFHRLSLCEAPISCKALRRPFRQRGEVGRGKNMTGSRLPRSWLCDRRRRCALRSRSTAPRRLGSRWASGLAVSVVLAGIKLAGP